MEDLEGWLRKNWYIPAGVGGIALLVMMAHKPGGGTPTTPPPPPTTPPTPPPPGEQRPSDLILIDPGHGGEDSGYIIGYQVIYKYWEKAMNLDFARRVKRDLVNGGFSVQSTRESDITVSLAQRKSIIARMNPKLIVSLHMGYKLRGTAGIVNSNPGSMRLAESIVPGLANVVNCGNRGIMTYQEYPNFPHHEILRAAEDVPCVVLEIAAIADYICFLPKYAIARVAPETTSNYLNQISAALANGIASYLGVM